MQKRTVKVSLQTIQDQIKNFHRFLTVHHSENLWNYISLKVISILERKI